MNVQPFGADLPFCDAAHNRHHAMVDEKGREDTPTTAVEKKMSCDSLKVE